MRYLYLLHSFLQIIFEIECLAALVSLFGDSLYALAITLSVYELSGSLAGVGYAMMGFGLLGLVYVVSLLAAACGKGQLRREVSSGEER